MKDQIKTEKKSEIDVVKNGASKSNLTFFSQMKSIKKEGIQGENNPYAIKNNCQLGMWVSLNGAPLGNNLKMILFDIIPFFGTLGQAKRTHWGQVWFAGLSANNGAGITPKDYLSVTYVKTASLNNLMQSITETFFSTEGEEKKDVLDYVCVATFKPKANSKGDNYFVLAFEWQKITSYESLGLNKQDYADFRDRIDNQSVILEDINLPCTMFSLREYQKEEALGLLRDIEVLTQN